MANQDACKKLNEAKTLMVKIKKELESIAYEIEKSATNIGEHDCANALRTIADDYGYAIAQIGKVV